MTDWAATGAMLQGIGTVIGAIAVIAAAWIGGNNFTAWRRQQLVQKKMSLAERMISAIFRAKEEIAAVRSPFMMGHETEQAAHDLVAQGINVDEVGTEKFAQFSKAQAYLNRINKRSDVWQEIESCRPLAYAYFDDSIPNEVDKILQAVNSIRVSAQELGEDDGLDKVHTKSIRMDLTSSRLREDPDLIKLQVNKAVENIEGTLRPLLQDYRNTNNFLMSPIAKNLVQRIIQIAAPF